MEYSSNIERSTELLFILGLNETIDKLAMARKFHWHGHVLKIDDGNVFRRALDFEVEGQWRKWRVKRTWKK